MAVTLTAPAAFRFIVPRRPRALPAFRALIRAWTSETWLRKTPGNFCSRHRQGCCATRLPNGLRAGGYTPDDVDTLVRGAPEHRVTKLSPRPATADDFRQMFLDSMTNW
jgi:hydroxyacid-oxoacid transhydrogenase